MVKELNVEGSSEIHAVGRRRAFRSRNNEIR
jgi:hypothetical protein